MSQKSLVPVNALSSASAPSTPTLQSGDLYYNTTTGLQVYNGTAWVATAGVTSVNGLTGAVTGLAPINSPAFTGIPSMPNIDLGYTTTATAGGTTTLTAASDNQQYFTGTSNQTVVLPVVSTLSLGIRYRIVNNSTGTITVNSSGGNAVTTILAGGATTVTCVLITGTTAASWDIDTVFVAVGNITGAGTGVTTFLTTPTSANLLAAVTNETGTGSLVFATSPTLVTPALGTPSSGTLTSCTGLPVASGISGLGTGVATFLATPSSANLATAVTGETGSGALVFGTSPTIATPTISSPVLQSPEERWTVSATAATGTITFNTSTQGVLYYTSNATATWVLNATNVNTNLAVGDAISIVFAVTNGATAYYPTALQIDGAAQTVKWAGGTAPAAGNANAVDWYSYVIVKTAATPTYTVFAGQSAKFA